jgi:glutathione synthase/RimK-type ligase-like ATP-grasp enzyme
MRYATTPTPEVCELALAAASAIEAALVGVDLLPAPDGGHVVIELNGAVEFNEQYSLDGGDVFERTVRALLREPVAAVA